MRRVLFLIVLAGCLQPAGEPARAVPAPEGEYAWSLVADGFDRPLGVLWDDELRVIEQCGRIRDGDGDVWLDISDRVACRGEQGLLGAAVDTQGRLYVSYTAHGGDSVLARMDGDEEVLMRIGQPAGNHNGGHIAMQGDLLYWGLGDGGGAGDVFGNGQDRDTPLGAILRIDVSADTGYAVPADNPFPDGDAPEVWAYGLRNPWRFSFDRATGDLWIGDVGENAWEEIDRIDGDHAGANFGWPVWEGRHRLQAGTAEGHIPPVTAYRNGADCSVTGGHVVRSQTLPGLEGVYLFGDFCTGIVRFVHPDGDGWATGTLMDTDFRISSFAEGPGGQVLLVDHAGGIYRLDAV